MRGCYTQEFETAHKRLFCLLWYFPLLTTIFCLNIYCLPCRVLKGRGAFVGFCYVESWRDLRSEIGAWLEQPAQSVLSHIHQSELRIQLSHCARVCACSPVQTLPGSSVFFLLETFTGQQLPGMQTVSNWPHVVANWDWGSDQDWGNTLTGCPGSSMSPLNMPLFPV